MLILPGLASVSPFRLNRLAASLPPLASLEVLDFFLVKGGQPQDLPALRKLLGDGPDAFPQADIRLFIVPRLGTVSPWSSKASDIARVCGLNHIQCIEQGRLVLINGLKALSAEEIKTLHDPMMESVLTEEAALQQVFDQPPARALRTVPVLTGGLAALEQANQDWGLALSGEEMAYLLQHYVSAGKNPTDAELMMFGQVNSEHCRHKIFNAEFTVDGEKQPLSLFQMIKESHKATPQGVLSAYVDNASVIEGFEAMRFFPESDHVWKEHVEPVHILMKVETHNHPTGISPHPGAATGAGGEIRDEAATGLGGKPKAGLAGFNVANLRLPALPQAWEADLTRPSRMASALQIMIEAPLGAAAYNNEFGRPNLCGYFRTLELVTPDGRNRGYHKPIMIAGGLGNIRENHVLKKAVPVGAALVVLGGPAMLIGLGGGAASSMATGSSSESLDYASVQRANPELERRCQEVVDACWALGEGNPILSIHDVGAGGISNALPELVHADDRGGHFQLRDVICADPSLSPMEIWCNESQERYVLALLPESVPLLQALCARERCPMAVVGTATVEQRLRVSDALGADAVDMPMPVLLGKPPKMQRRSTRQPQTFAAVPRVPFAEAAHKVLQLPSVASKQFLITIGDRTVGGLTVRDQFVGPYQVPVADCAVTATGFEADTGEAMSMGERPLLAVLDAAASGRMAVGEAITNLMAARIGKLSDVRLSANWMAACGQGDEDARLFDAVKAVGAELCPALGLAIPVGKDSLSMKSVWQADGENHSQTAPVSLVVSAFAPVLNVRHSLTPEVQAEGTLVLIDLGNGQNRLGGSALAQVLGVVGDVAPDLDHPQQLQNAFDLVQSLNQSGEILAYHDRSDGGLFATLCEMAFAGHCGLHISVDSLDALPFFFSEELGLVLQVKEASSLLKRCASLGLTAIRLGQPSTDDHIRLHVGGAQVFAASRAELHQLWSRTSTEIARLRDNPACVAEEESTPVQQRSVKLTYTPSAPAIITNVLQHRPKVAIVREQGVNGQAEMAYAFHAAGFEAVDVHMTDLLGGLSLDSFKGFVACGGFSYGDVLGAGQGWAQSILLNPQARNALQAFFHRPDTFALGVCNGCQMMSSLKGLMPGAAHWPAFKRNLSEQFEARWTMVEVQQSPSLFFAGMAGSQLPIAVAHGEGRAVFASAEDQTRAHTPLKFLGNSYPINPNGSPDGITSVCNDDGRITILMPHPERTIAGTTGSWWPKAMRDQAKTPWFEMFLNARKWVG